MSRTSPVPPSRIWTSRPPSTTPRLHRTRTTLSGLFAVLLLVATVGLISPGEGSPSWELAAAGAAAAVDDTVPGQLLVRFADDAPGNASERARASVGAEAVGRIDPLGVEVWRVPAHAAERALAGLQRHPHVDYAEQDTVVELDEVTPNDPWFDRQWGLEQVQAPTAWATSKGSPSVTIAILDTGVAPVADLADQLLPGWNIPDGNTDTTDAHGHGTLSAGVAAASTDNGAGVASYCWDCSILPVKVMESSGTMSDLAAGIIWAVDNGADVISMSLSGSSGTTTVHNAVRYAQDSGVVLVAAAGNQAATEPRYPAAYPEVIGVAGSTSTDELYSWSNHGSWVDVAAPGQNRSTYTDGSIFLYAGTSSATPAVAGVLGLALALEVPGPEARTALLASAADFAGVEHGRVDAAAMLALLAGDPDPEPEPEPEPEPDPTAPPEADLSVACQDLECVFDASASSAPDGDIVSFSWALGNGSSRTGEVISDTYAEAGTYEVILTVTDDVGGSDSATATVTVTEPEPPAEDEEPPGDDEPEPAPEVHLSVTTSKHKGLTEAHLVWSGATTSEVDLRIDGDVYATVTNDGAYDHATGLRGNPTITYQVCETGSPQVCSDVIEVSSW